MANAVEQYGWTAVLRDPAGMLRDTKTSDLRPLTISDVKEADTPLAKAIKDYAKAELPTQTFNHSMRVYHYGT